MARDADATPLEFLSGALSTAWEYAFTMQQLTNILAIFPFSAHSLPTDLSAYCRSCPHQALHTVSLHGLPHQLATLAT